MAAPQLAALPQGPPAMFAAPPPPRGAPVRTSFGSYGAPPVQHHYMPPPPVNYASYANGLSIVEHPPVKLPKIGKEEKKKHNPVAGELFGCCLIR